MILHKKCALLIVPDEETFRFNSKTYYEVDYGKFMRIALIDYFLMQVHSLLKRLNSIIRPFKSFIQ